VESRDMMRLAYIHPGKESDKKVTPEFFTALEGAIRSVARPDTSVEVWGLPGPLPEEDEMPYWYVHPKIFSAMIANAKRAEKAGFDGVVIGCVGATDAEYAIKEALNIPVVGIGESCLLLAEILGQNFSIITYNNKIAAWIDRLVTERHIGGRCVSVRPMNISLGEALGRDRSVVIREKMLTQAKRAMEEDRAEVIINASAGLVGMADYLRKNISAPVVDAVESGVKFAEMLVDLRKTKGLLQSKVASFQASPNTDKVIAEFF
jgi:allantoin racemase